MNFETQARTPKDSARFYSDVIATNGAVLAGESTTWLALQRDKIVFAVADRAEVDQNGKTVAALTKVFRRLAKK